MADLLRKPLGRDGLVHTVTPENAGWRYVGFELHRLSSGAAASGLTQDREAILVMVEGRAQVQAAGQDWGVLGDRMDVFEKTAPHCLYIPPHRTGRSRQRQIARWRSALHRPRAAIRRGVWGLMASP